jgi:hypothetical protein
MRFLVAVCESFGDSFAFVVARPGSERICIAPVLLRLRGNLGIPIDLYISIRAISLPLKTLPLYKLISLEGVVFAGIQGMQGTHRMC